MEKSILAVKVSRGVADRVKKFCAGHGIKYGFFVEKALEDELELEELKEDLLDLKALRGQEKSAIPFEQYLKSRNV